MEKLKIVIKKYWKIYLAALVISAVCDLIGTVKLNIGVGTLTLFPMVFAVIFGGLLGPDIFKVFKTEECKIGGSLVLVVLAPFMAKMGISTVQSYQGAQIFEAVGGFSGSCITSSGIRKPWNDSFIYASRIIAWFKEGIYWCMLLN